MGADTSLPLSPVRPGFSTMCLTFQYTDRITVLHLDDSGLSIVRQAINETWRSGIQNEQTRCGSAWSFKLNGRPFLSGTGSETSQQARRMVCQILQKLYGVGWKFDGSADLGRYEDKSTLFFKRSAPEFSTSPFICVGLSSWDKLQFVNLPSQLVEPVRQAVRQSWSLGIQNESSNNDVLEIKLSGNPWRATDQQSIMAKVMLQNIIATLHHYQYVYYCNVNTKSTADSLIFRQDPNVPFGQPQTFCTISLNRHDRLRVINAPGPIVDMIRKVIQTTWSPGMIQNERDYNGSWEFKISGNPWHSTKHESVMARFLVLKILEAMLQQGWHCIAAVDINRRPTDKSVLFFQKGEPKHCPMMCLSLNDVDKFRLINMPAQMADLFKTTLLSRWSKGIQAEKQLTLSFGMVNQFKLSGCPWMGGERNDTIHARSFLCGIIEEFRQRGWLLLLCADVSAKYVSQDNGPDYPIDVHSIWFIYDPANSAQPSAPTYGFNVSSGPGQFGIGIPSGMPAASAPMSGYGLQATPFPQSTIYPQVTANPSEPPPTYSEATGWK